MNSLKLISCYRASVSHEIRPQDLALTAFKKKKTQSFIPLNNSSSDLQATQMATFQWKQQMGRIKQKRLRLKRQRERGESEKSRNADQTYINRHKQSKEAQPFDGVTPQRANWKHYYP